MFSHFLHTRRWDSIRLLEEYYGAADSNQIFEKANIANPNDDTNVRLLLSLPPP